MDSPEVVLCYFCRYAVSPARQLSLYLLVSEPCVFLFSSCLLFIIMLIASSVICLGF